MKKELVLLFLILSCVGVMAMSNTEIVPFPFKNKIYIIRNVIDLKGKEIIIPEGCKIKFVGKGIIKNGVLTGNKTIIKASKKKYCIFQRVRINGDWKVNKIYDYWFDIEDNTNNTQSIKNIFALCSDNVVNEVFFSNNTYWLDCISVDKKNPALIRIPSNTRVHNKAIFKVLPGAYEKLYLFSFFNVSNCLWDGGAIEGDLQQHEGETGEHGFGIALRGAQDITIKNVSCSDCWGDGINLQYAGEGKHNNNILIKNVKCNGNRRQGISVCDGIGVKIVNSNFLNTGQRRGTAPGYGIDIEPSYDDAIICKISIEDCTFNNNVGGGVCCSFIKESDSDISIINCTDNNGGLRLNNCQISVFNEGIKICGYKCPNGKLRFKREVQNIRFENCSFMSALNQSANKDVLKNIVFHRVKLKTKEQRTWNFFCLSLLCAKTENVKFNSCSFEVLEGSSLTAVLPYSGDWSGVSMNGCTIIDNRKNPFYIPCDIINSNLVFQSTIVFVNQKSEGGLKFNNNKIAIANSVHNSPFVFMSSSNQDYELINNTINYSGHIDMDNLIMKDKHNTGSPSVTIIGNKFNLIK